jgi:hypothetical protein
MRTVSVITERARWLLLIHQLPTDPAYLRVKVGRRLSRLGAIALKNSVYVLPTSENANEDFQWVRREILDGGGDATIVEAQLVEGLSDQEVESKFRQAKDAEYDELIREAREIEAGRRKRWLSDGERSATLAQVDRLERRLQEAATTDFFGASGREVLAGLLLGLRAAVELPRLTPKPATDPLPIRGATWVTRAGVHVDRIASAWLVRRFVDTEASFKFVSAKGYVPLEGELRFDMFDAEFSHQGDRCTFETLVSRFDISEPGMPAIAEVVHDIDLKESRFARPETAGIAACVAAICRVCRKDEERLLHGGILFEGLLAHFAAKKGARG